MKKVLAVSVCLFWLAWIVRYYINVTSSGQGSTGQLLPMVINTWPFSVANEEAWRILNLKKGGIGQTRDAVVGGISECERLQCDKAVGFGGNANERGYVALDALLMDGSTMEIGAVGHLRRMRSAIKVARHVLEHTHHSFLVGDGAADFANAMGFQNESLDTPETAAITQNWTAHNCQPNYWRNVYPDPLTSCGPYQPLTLFDEGAPRSDQDEIGPDNHDTITMAAIDEEGNIHVGTSTNGIRHTIPGRVGDAPIPGSGAYADNEVGAAVATGNGDILMRFLPSLLAVEAMRAGKTPAEAVKSVFQRIRKHIPRFEGALIAVDRFGNYAAVCRGVSYFKEKFHFMVSSPANPNRPTRMETVMCATEQYEAPSELYPDVIW
ncbi:putative N(4)-(beta-N-acetylglucosaminyl)-L-asparaginase GD10667 [Drosophila takahashii]|uniref:putative N(4)-(beta-N-acetylglucosaminyl)-L-asparaginase GD10667 n=1 Tax=Drosophila takahashii TaxID=29030 RepID=UPI001CF8E2DF|nr:putative N(4)-(beta-N-acetylglucosaminyl)-L-asparaginase GD10667 [Drosophila takahashii]